MRTDQYTTLDNTAQLDCESRCHQSLHPSGISPLGPLPAAMQHDGGSSRPDPCWPTLAIEGSQRLRNQVPSNLQRRTSNHALEVAGHGARIQPLAANHPDAPLLALEMHLRSPLLPNDGLIDTYQGPTRQTRPLLIRAPPRAFAKLDLFHHCQVFAHLSGVHTSQPVQTTES